MLVNATHSAENLAYQLHDYLSAQKSVSKDNVKAFVRKTLLERGLGVYDATDDEVSRLAENSDPWPASYIFADIISRRAQIGWSTHGHSGTYPFSNAKPLSFPLTPSPAVDVNIYASDPRHAQPLVGNHENTEIGGFIRDYLGLNLDAITRDLEAHAAIEDTGRLWMGRPVEDERTLAQEDHYHGDFKRSLECGCGH